MKKARAITMTIETVTFHKQISYFRMLNIQFITCILRRKKFQIAMTTITMETYPLFFSQCVSGRNSAYKYCNNILLLLLLLLLAFDINLYQPVSSARRSHAQLPIHRHVKTKAQDVRQ